MRLASGDNNFFQFAGAEFGDQLTEHLGLLVSVGGNDVRNTMSSRDRIIAIRP
ncbi:MAG: hypothetical protein GY953_04510 [bacterium]|nr:hypothetical protein [bacterium]